MKWLFAILLSFLVFSIEETHAVRPSQLDKIIVGSELDYPPYALVNEDGQPDGFSVDLIKAVCAAANIELSFRVGPWNEVRAALEHGEIDALPLVSYSKEREKVFDFTPPHTITHGVIFKRKGSPKINSASDLRGEKIMVMQSDAGHDWLLRNDISDNLKLTKTVSESLSLLSKGNSKYALAPRLVGLITAKEMGLSNIEVTGPLLDAYGRGFGFAVKEGNAELLARLNEGLSIIKMTGVYDEIYQKWFGGFDPKGIPSDILFRYLTIGIVAVTLLIGMPLSWSFSLKRQVRVRTQELDAEILERKKTETALYLAKEEAEFANNAKSDFLAAMSHDLRTPLNAVMGFSEMMRSKTFGPLGDPHYETYANDIFNSGSLLVSLINDVLDLSKVEAGKYVLVEENLDIDDLIQSSFRQVMKMAEASQQTLISDLDTNLPLLKGDERALIQIFNNLLSNSIKFTPKGGKINVTVRIAEDKAIAISVMDNGIGMSPDGISKALQPFEQADGMHSRRHEGTGLGLHLCSNFMHLFGGTLEIKSVIDEGTTVNLHFPPDRSMTNP
jgi:signal transduction histidine kinase